MAKYKLWSELRAEHVERAGGEQAVEQGKQKLRADLAASRLPEAPESESGSQPPHIPSAS
jgi:hypothetical protein